ncbi:MAG: outer membrane protein [Polynucleobacter sp.]
MNKKLLAAVVAMIISGSAMAQSAFEGFYGQIGTGYESNQFGDTNITGGYTDYISGNWNAGSQNANGAPLVLGLGYNFSVAPQWLLGVGVDYSAISQSTSTYSSHFSETGNFSGSKLQASNRVNIFITPGYAIDKDKLIYAKAGYSMVTINQTYPNYYNNVIDPSASVNLNYGSQSKTVGGYVIGLGYKQMFDYGIYGFAEANYMSYSKASFSSTSDFSYTISSSPSLNSYQALVGIGYKF